ncbi:hypothetical protein O7632_16075 [Solwaraspora sp. WMMD406]|uniref:hypothetical protein n=1 Tax=Solwaraspora sp. WMMD406 TaxID=3016095 RepID=UPI0024172188|nr:hypothetical protein [Solwaraspora sp. WMMD406]MDG4765603.1 hypothetical protein [Solwaraspora sp. WMMD406]
MLKFLRNAIVAAVTVMSTSLVLSAPAEANFPSPPVGALIEVRFYTTSAYTTEIGKWVYGACDGVWVDQDWGSRSHFYRDRVVPCYV